MVPKKGPCGDYRRLNTIMVPDRYPLPNMMDLSANMDGCTVFSKIDLVKAFHQVPIAPEDRQKAAVITLFGFFEYNYMHLASVMLPKHSKGWRIKFLKTCPVLLFI
jgi:hypothetical protein